MVDPNPNRLLIIRNSHDISCDEIIAVSGVAGALGFETSLVDRSQGQIVEDVALGCYNTVYLAGHAHVDGCGLSNPIEPWASVADSICKNACITEGTLVFCACCYGGVKTVAREFFVACNIQTVVGPDHYIYPPSLMTGFAVLMHQVHFNNAAIRNACQMASYATFQNFRDWDFDLYRNQQNLR